jgi:cobalt/nickel transport system permease protein
MPAMLGVHALIGIGEALITVAALAFLFRTRPDLLEGEATAAQGGRGWVVAGLATALAVVLLSPLASADPDGLERVAEDLGFIDRGMDAPYQILPDYTIPLLGETPLSTIVAGALGVVIVAGVTIAAVRWAGRLGTKSEGTAS